MQIVNITKRVDDGKKKLFDWEKIKGIAVHRVGVDDVTGATLGYDGPTICNAFTKDPSVGKYTGYQLAYTFIIGGRRGPDPKGTNGVVWQCLDLGDVGYHARRFSAPYIGIALVGDFRSASPSTEQMTSLIDLCRGLCVGWGIDPYRSIKGHGEITGAHDGSKAPGEPNACPGGMLNMFEVRDDVAMLIKDKARCELFGSGLSLS